jgi:exopolyphosphatase / guanosine-5'-triphosphate,3'-diphosphate pyrophosphatase
MRDASNGQRLVERAARELGVQLEVIGGAREASLTFGGALPHGTLPRGTLPRDTVAPTEELTAIDVGGGSTEIATGRGRELSRAASLDVGSVRLFERHLRTDPPGADEVGALEQAVDAALARSGAAFAGRLVALAGTACTVAAIARGIATPDARAVDGIELGADELHGVAERLAKMTFRERRAIPGVPLGRADVIAAGALLLSRIVRRAGADRLTISDGGVRWGLALELLP